MFVFPIFAFSYISAFQIPLILILDKDNPSKKKTRSQLLFYAWETKPSKPSFHYMKKQLLLNPVPSFVTLKQQLTLTIGRNEL